MKERIFNITFFTVVILSVALVIFFYSRAMESETKMVPNPGEWDVHAPFILLILFLLIGTEFAVIPKLFGYGWCAEDYGEEED